MAQGKNTDLFNIGGPDPTGGSVTSQENLSSTPDSGKKTIKI